MHNSMYRIRVLRIKSAHLPPSPSLMSQPLSEIQNVFQPIRAIRYKTLISEAAFMKGTEGVGLAERRRCLKYMYQTIRQRYVQEC